MSRTPLAWIMLIAAGALTPISAAEPLPEPTPVFQADLPEILDRWDAEYVDPIITPEERERFRGLRDTQERLAFVERFWLRRDPTPRTPENEYRQDYRQRYQHALERYGAGTPGWRTDRGRTYIILGPPASVWTYPSGAAGQGFPAEVWTYNALPSARLDASVDLTFVDSSGTGDYRLVSDRDLLFTSRSGATRRGLEEYARIGPDGQRLRGLDPYMGGVALRDQTSFLETLTEVERLAEPPIQPPGRVSTEMSLSHLEVRATWAAFLAEPGRTLLGVTFDVDAQGLKSSPVEEGSRVLGRSYILDLFAALEKPDGSFAAEYQTRIHATIPSDAPPDRNIAYSFGLVAPPGEYGLKLALVDPRSRRAGGIVRKATLDPFPTGGLALSSITLVGGEDHLPEPEPRTDPFRLRPDLRLIPALEQRAHATEPLPIHFQAYGLPPEGASLSFAFLHPDGRPALVLPPERLVPKEGTTLSVHTRIPTTGLAPGSYRLRVALGRGEDAATRELPLELVAKPE